MSWIDQGRQQHGWFGHGIASAAPASAQELRERAFAIVHLANDHAAEHGATSVPLAKTTEILRTLAPFMAPSSHLPPNEFRQRFFRDGFDPVDAWHFQLFMRDVADADDHASLKEAGRALAKTIDDYGAKDWSSMLGRAVANVAPAQRSDADARPGPIQKAQLTLPAPTMLPIPPVAVPGSRENEEYFVKPAIKLGRAIGDAVGNIFRSESPDDDKPASGGTSPHIGPSGRIELPENPDDLLKQGWTETTHPKQAANGRRTFKHEGTGDELEFDKGKPDGERYQAVDHYHWPNPETTGKRDKYLDQSGEPVPDMSKRLHILPKGAQ